MGNSISWTFYPDINQNFRIVDLSKSASNLSKYKGRKNVRKLANGHKIYDFEKEIVPRVILTLPWGYLLIYDHYSQIHLLVYGQQREKFRQLFEYYKIKNTLNI